jgi:hypothetical protein
MNDIGNGTAMICNDPMSSEAPDPHLRRALDVRAETAALIRAAEDALDRSENALHRLRRQEERIKTIALVGTKLRT